MFKLIFQSIDKRRAQSFSIVATIMLSVAVIFAALLSYYGISQGVEKSSARMGADLLVIPQEAGNMLDEGELLFTGAPMTIYMNKEAEHMIAGIKGVKQITTQFYGQTLNSGCCSTGAQQRIIGYDADTDWVIAPWAKTAINGALKSEEVVIGCNVGGFENGRGTLLGRNMKVAAVLEETGTSLDSSIFVDIDIAREFSSEIKGYEHFWEKYGNPQNLVSAILIKTEPEKKNSVKNLIEMNGDYKCIVAGDTLEDIQNQMKMIFWIMFAIGTLMCLAAILQIFARFYLMAWDRKSELGLYRALGASEKNLKQIIFGEAVILMETGAVIGLGLGTLFYRLFISLMMKETAFPFISPSPFCMIAETLIIIGGALAIAWIAVIVPLHQIGRIEPMQAMHKTDID